MDQDMAAPVLTISFSTSAPTFSVLRHATVGDVFSKMSSLFFEITSLENTKDNVW